MEEPAAGKAAAPREVLPKAGLVYSDKGVLKEVLCKPKIMPLKSVTLEKLQQMERRAAEVAAEPEADLPVFS